MQDIGQLIARSVANALDQPATGVRELVERAKAGDQSVTLGELVPAVEELLVAVERFTSQARTGGSSPAR